MCDQEPHEAAFSKLGYLRKAKQGARFPACAVEANTIEEALRHWGFWTDGGVPGLDGPRMGHSPAP
eukprot:7792260-Alexandrium_andersonii.AAC.1